MRKRNGGKKDEEQLVSRFPGTMKGRVELRLFNADVFAETNHGPDILIFEKKKPLRRKPIAFPWKQKNNRQTTYFANAAILFDNWVI